MTERRVATSARAILRPMQIALIGTRGVPARYGGAETCAEELSVRLVERGHHITVYCRRGNVAGNPEEHAGVHLVYLPNLEAKALGSITHGWVSLLHAVFQDYDCLHVFNVGNTPICFLPRLLGKKIVMMTDGLDWKRGKWGRVMRQCLQAGEYLATRVATELVADSRAIQRYYLERYGAPSTFIPYGAYIDVSKQPELLREFGLERDDYFLVVTRLEPENNPDITVRAFEGVRTDKKLVIVGGANYRSRFVKSLMSTRDRRIVFLPPLYDRARLKELFSNCYAYVHGNEVGGTNPALLQAMGYGNAVLALNVIYNAEVVEDAALLFEKSPEDLREKMQCLVSRPDLVHEYRKAAVGRIEEAYTWEQMVDRYEQLFSRMVFGDGRAPS